MFSPPFASAKAGDVSPFPTTLLIKVLSCQRFLPIFQKIFLTNAKNPTKRKGLIGYVILLFYRYDFLHHI